MTGSTHTGPDDQAVTKTTAKPKHRLLWSKSNSGPGKNTMGVALEGLQQVDQSRPIIYHLQSFLTGCT